MNKAKVQYFMYRQRKLAERISEELGGVDYSVIFFQNYYLSDEDRKTGYIYFDTTQIIFAFNLLPGRKSRVLVSFYFKGGEYDKKILDRIMCRWYKVVLHDSMGFGITYSVNLNSIGSCSF